VHWQVYYEMEIREANLNRCLWAILKAIVADRIDCYANIGHSEQPESICRRKFIPGLASHKLNTHRVHGLLPAECRLVALARTPVRGSRGQLTGTRLYAPP
jgi:hypothetical protein